MTIKQDYTKREIAQKVLSMNKNILLNIRPVDGRDGFISVRFTFKAPTSQDYDSMEQEFDLPHNWSVNIIHQVYVSKTKETYDGLIYFDDKTMQLKGSN